ncbi:MAG: hypothetical protein K8S99_02825 [Planctomycetes bacterium]|nr:hypothetical protein [Planctomycetota bacterium]
MAVHYRRLLFTALLMIPLVSAASAPPTAARPTAPAAPLLTLQPNGDLTETTGGRQARVLASANHYQKIGDIIIALPPGPDPTSLIVYEPLAGNPGAYRQRFVLHSDGIAAATGVLDVKLAPRRQLLIELHINPSTNCFVLLDLATGTHRDVLGIEAAVSSDGTRLASLAGPPHHFPRKEYLDVVVDGKRIRHIVGATYGQLNWRDAATIDIRFPTAPTGATPRRLAVRLPH